MATSVTTHFCHTYPCPVCKPYLTVPSEGFGTFDLRPCEGDFHDYAVGERFAICNRCDAVVPLDKEDSDG